MNVHRARPEEASSAARLARALGLDYPGLEEDPIWIAVEDGETAGLVALKRHADCLELCGLGVDPRFRGRGLGRALVEALMAEAPGDVHLATTIPAFFEGCGFHIVTRSVPAAFPAKRRTAWCEGCRPERCTVMRRAKP